MGILGGHMAKRKRRSLGLVEVSSPVYKLIRVIMLYDGFLTELEAIKSVVEHEAKRRDITISSIG